MKLVQKRPDLQHSIQIFSQRSVSNALIAENGIKFFSVHLEYFLKRKVIRDYYQYLHFKKLVTKKKLLNFNSLSST